MTFFFCYISVPRKVELSEHIGTPIITGGDFTTTTCQALFGAAVEAYKDDQCQCRANTVINDDKNRCCKTNMKTILIT